MEYLFGRSSNVTTAPSTLPAVPILPLVDLSTLERWDQAPKLDDTSAAEQTNLDPVREEDSSITTVNETNTAAHSSGTIQFPVNDALNRKLILCRGDLLGLKADAIVWSTNERLNDLPLSSLGCRLLSYAGPGLSEELGSIVRNDGGVATGDSAVVSSHQLGKLHGASKWLIATVAPKYSARFQTAAENALHGCVRRSLELLLDQGLHTIAFPLLTNERKEYPPEAAAHIIFRTMRKFMERYGEKTLRTVVICLPEEDEPVHHHSKPHVISAPTVPQGATVSSSSVSSSSNTAATAAAPAPPLAPFPRSSEIYAIYQRLLPLYFPRSSAEESLQRTLLPAYSGNELGETVVEERRIRIAEGASAAAVPSISAGKTEFIASGPKPLDLDTVQKEQQRAREKRQKMQQEHEALQANVNSQADGSESKQSDTGAEIDHPLALGSHSSGHTTASASLSSSSSAASSTPAPRKHSSSVLPSAFLPSKTEYVSPSDMPSESSNSSGVGGSHAPTGVRHHDPVKHGGFASATDHPDSLRGKSLSTSSSLTPQERAQEQQENHAYYQALKIAQSCHHADMSTLDAARYIYEEKRRDVLGRRIIHFVGSRVPLYHLDGSPHVSRDSFTDHVIRTLDPLTLHPFIAVYWHCGVDGKNRPDIGWFKQMYSLFPRSQRANMKQLIVVHPTWYLRSAMYVLASFVETAFWNKLVYCYKLDELAKYIDPRSLAIPPHVLQHDRLTNGTSTLTANPEQDDEVGF